MSTQSGVETQQQQQHNNNNNVTNSGKQFSSQELASFLPFTTGLSELEKARRKYQVKHNKHNKTEN